MVKKKFLFKILLVGKGGAGKTSLLRRYVDDLFDESTIMTVGVDFFLKEINLEDGDCTLQLWDFGGQERFKHLHSSYVMGARGALLLVDLTIMPSLKSIQEWVSLARLHNNKLPISLVGTKLDLGDFIAVDDEFMNKIKDKYGFIEYTKTSSKTGYNVHRVFKELTQYLLKNSKY